MNAKQFQYEFGIQLNQFDEALQLDSDDIEYWLNRSQLFLVKNKYNGLNQQRKAFEQSQQRVDDLRVLLTRDFELTTIYSNKESGTTGFFVDYGEFPNDYMFLISQKSKVIYSHPTIEWILEGNKREPQQIPQQDIHTKVVSNRVSQSDDIYKLLDDPFNTTKITSPLALITENKLYIFTNKKFIVDKIFIDYLRLPRKISIKDNVTSELPEHLHNDIIQTAVDLFLNNTRELKQRLQRETPTANKQQIEEDNE